MKTAIDQIVSDTDSEEDCVPIIQTLQGINKDMVKTRTFQYDRVIIPETEEQKDVETFSMPTTCLSLPLTFKRLRTRCGAPLPKQIAHNKGKTVIDNANFAAIQMPQVHNVRSNGNAFQRRGKKEKKETKPLAKSLKRKRGTMLQDKR
jgi:hypothetical protein